MSPATSEDVRFGDPLSWYKSRHYQRAIVIGLLVTAIVYGYVAIFCRRNDFDCHVAFGSDFLNGDPYKRAGNIYPLGRAMMNAALALPNYYVARTACYTTAVIGLAASLLFWLRMAGRDRAIESTKRLPVVFATLVALLPFVFRDLDECGLQLILLSILSSAAYAWHTGRYRLCGFCLALGVVYKATPLLFLPFLLWKREWKSAAWMAVFTLALSLLPAVYLGWDEMVAANKQWCQDSAYIMTHTPDAYPSNPFAEIPKTQNLSLTAALARYLETYEPGHPLNLKHPLFFQFGDLPVVQAKLAVRTIILTLGAVIAWKFRHRWRQPEQAGQMPREWAVACLFTAILSPVCWQQHLVLAIPCVFVIMYEIAVDARRQMWRTAVLGVCGAIFLFSRHDVAGRENALLLYSYKFDTLALLAIVFTAMSIPKSQQVPCEETLQCRTSALQTAA